MEGCGPQPAATERAGSDAPAPAPAPVRPSGGCGLADVLPATLRGTLNRNPASPAAPQLLTLGNGEVTKVPWDVARPLGLGRFDSPGCSPPGALRGRVLVF